MQEYSLFSHVGVFQDVYIDEERLLMFTHTTQKQSPFLQQAFNMETKVKDHGIVKLTSLFVFPKQTVDKTCHFSVSNILPSKGKSLMSLAGS